MAPHAIRVQRHVGLLRTLRSTPPLPPLLLAGINAEGGWPAPEWYAAGMRAAGEGLLRHWTYVPEGEDLLPTAYAWQKRKTAQGKWYRVIEAGSAAQQEAGLRQVGNHDVLYILARSVHTMQKPEELAAHLERHGLDAGHRVVKVFASYSGDPGVSAEFARTSYAERLYNSMRVKYPEVVVYGYHGEVTANGFSGHKSAGLMPGDTLEGISESEWNRRGLRAKANRVRFPPGPLDD